MIFVLCINMALNKRSVSGQDEYRVQWWPWQKIGLKTLFPLFIFCQWFELEKSTIAQIWLGVRDVISVINEN